MANSFYTNTSYFPQQEQTINSKSHKNTKLFLAGATVGGLAGGYFGYRQNPVITKDGAIKDTFAKNIYKNLSNSGSEITKSQEKNLLILKKLKNIKNVDELKILANENPEIFSEIKINIDNIDKNSLKENMKAIEGFINAKNNNEFLNFKNSIQKCWNAETKKFEKFDEISEEFFNTIKKTVKKLQITKVLKSAGIGALIAGILVFIPKFISTNKN